jgi:hypothetical protein
LKLNGENRDKSAKRKMKLERLKLLVQRAIDTFYTRDPKLFSVEASEWAIAHRLAVYLEKEIPGWNVDCEYNKQGENSDPKTNAQTGGETDRTRPDIILHHRGELALEHNLLVIELKKEKENSDLKKAKEFTAPLRAEDKRKFQYQYGLALSFRPTFSTHWYKSGKPVR